MADSLAAAVAALIGGLGLNRPVVVGQPRPGQMPPYVLVVDRLPVTREPRGDNGADDTAVELVQVEDVQLARTGDWTPADPAVVDALIDGLNGAALTGAPYAVHGMHVDGVTVLPDPTPNIARTAITVRVRRSLRRLP